MNFLGGSCNETYFCVFRRLLHGIRYILAVGPCGAGAYGPVAVYSGDGRDHPEEKMSFFFGAISVIPEDRWQQTSCVPGTLLWTEAVGTPAAGRITGPSAL